MSCGSRSHLSTHGLEIEPAAPRELVRGVKRAHEVFESLLELVDAHPFRHEVDVEQCAAVPVALAEEPPLGAKAPVQRRAGKWRQHGDLDFHQSAVFNEALDLDERVRCVRVETEDEAPVDGHPASLDLVDHAAVATETSRF